MKVREKRAAVQVMHQHGVEVLAEAICNLLDARSRFLRPVAAYSPSGRAYQSGSAAGRVDAAIVSLIDALKEHHQCLIELDERGEDE